MTLCKIKARTYVTLATQVALVAIFIVCLGAAPSAAAVWQRTYTLDADFAEGVLDGVNYTEVPDQLQLNRVPTTFPFAWIANSGEGTVSKIDTATGVEVARYRTGPNGGGDSPSRTAVDIDGYCWVANRAYNLQGSVVKISATGGEDRNGNGVIDTSTGPGDVKPWWEDEAVVVAVNVGGGNGLPRSLAIDMDGNIWVGLYNESKYVGLDSDGAWIADVPVSHHPYGAAIDAHGTLWSAAFSWGIDKVDIASRTYVRSYHLGGGYGITVDSAGAVWVGGYGSSADVFRFDPTTEAVQAFDDPDGCCGRGVCQDSFGSIWVALGYGWPNNLVAKFASDGTHLGTYTVGSNPCGVGTDRDGNIIVVCQGSWDIYKLDRNTGAALWHTPVGNAPYTYSDFTGYVIRNITQKTGTWTVVFDSQALDAPWGKATWDSSEPEGTLVSVQVRSANTVAGLDLQPWLDVSNGVDFVPGIAGQYIQIKTRLTTTTEDSPILYDLTIQAANQPPDTSDAYPDQACLWPPNHKMAPINILGVTDPDGDPITITITKITSDEPTASDPGSGGAKHAPDADGIGKSVASVRAECSGTRNGRIYKISFTASDDKGAVSNGSVIVCVPHDMGKCNEAIDDGQKYDATKIN